MIWSSRVLKQSSSGQHNDVVIPDPEAQPSQEQHQVTSGPEAAPSQEQYNYFQPCLHWRLRGRRGGGKMEKYLGVNGKPVVRRHCM